MGGYILPSLSTRGSHVHLSSAAMPSMTMAMWLPQPHHVAFSDRGVSPVRSGPVWPIGRKVVWGFSRTALVAGCFSTHVGYVDAEGLEYSMRLLRSRVGVGRYPLYLSAWPVPLPHRLVAVETLRVNFGGLPDPDAQRTT